MKHIFTVACALTLLVAMAASPTFASFHEMQIEQVIGGVNGDTSIQAIQLRERVAFQNLLSQGPSLIVRDAAGNNPVTLITFNANVSNAAAGARILVVSPNFVTAYPGVTPDFVMTNVIPPSYLAAGKLTFEHVSFPPALWSLAWGGASYTGTNTGNVTNDADGNFGPAFAGALPSSTAQALQFTGAAGDPSTTNAANYALTAGDAIFTNNTGAGATLPVELSEFEAE